MAGSVSTKNHKVLEEISFSAFDMHILIRAWYNRFVVLRFRTAYFLQKVTQLYNDCVNDTDVRNWRLLKLKTTLLLSSQLKEKPRCSS